MTTEQVSLGELIALLERRDADQRVGYDFCRFIPKDVDSYRGFYEQLAIGYEELTYNNTQPTVAVLLAELRAAVGKTFQGYKGGDYVMSKRTPMWVANYGSSTNTMVVGVGGNDYETILLTAWES